MTNVKYNYKNFKIFVNIVFLIICSGISAQVKLNINPDTNEISINPYLYGIFLEDINHAIDGGLYAELVSNRSFEDDNNSPVNWATVQLGDATGEIMLDATNLLNNNQKYSLKIDLSSILSNGKFGVSNSGFWGMYLERNKKYKCSFFAKCSENFNGNLIVLLENSSGTAILASDTIKGLTINWNKYECELIPDATASQGKIVILIDSIGSVWIDVVSLFSPSYNNRKNGLRSDLVQMLIDMKPSFMRFPGGCFVEGDFMANRFQWKNTVGNIENRPGHWNLWGYRTSDGMGYHEYLQLAEDLNAAAMYVVNIGIAHNDYVPYNQIDSLIQDVLDAIEYAKGDTSTKYGKLRSINGHPEPYNLMFIELGNENAGGDHYSERYISFYNAIKAKYPEIKIIGNVEHWLDNPSWKINAPVDLIDEHYYRDPQWFINNSTKYDKYNRLGPDIYVGEYAVTSNCGYGNLIAAIGEAAFMTGFERNADIIGMASYAPLFVNVNDRKWNPDLINYNSNSCYGTPSYYVQKMFSNNTGDLYFPIKEEFNNQNIKPVTGKIGLGTWKTYSMYDDIEVKKDNITIYLENFEDSNSLWSIYKGSWSIENGVYTQTSLLEDCRSISSNIVDSSYAITLKAKKVSGDEGFLIIFGYVDDNNFYWWNIGGWNNTRHAIEKCNNGVKTQIASVNGNIISNKWYDIKIEIVKGEIKCFLDGVLIHNFIPEPNKILYVSTTKDSKNNEIFLKVVNVTQNSVNTNINFKGNILNNINITTLTSSNILDENSLNNPYKVAPSSTNIEPSSNFYYSFPANSVNILKFNYFSFINKKKISNKNLKIFPNPINNDIFFLKMPETEINKPYSLMILDINGKILFKKNFIYTMNNKFIINNISDGVYNLILYDNERFFSNKVIIMNNH